MAYYKKRNNQRKNNRAETNECDSIWKNLSNVQDTRVNNYNNYVNIEHSTYPLLCKSVYSALGTDFSNQIPFAMFLHGMTGYLYANLFIRCNEFRLAGVDVEEYEFCTQIAVPKPIYEYVAAIGKIKLQSGEIVRINLPKIAIPDDGSESIAAGTFGKVNESTSPHNVYECYISPYVTKRLIEETIRANESDEFPLPENYAWNPLPDDYAPPNAVATKNLLGYLVPERISHGALKVLQSLQFRSDDRLCSAIDILTKIQNSRRLSRQWQYSVSNQIEYKVTDATFAFLRRSNNSNATELFSPVPLTSQDSRKALIFGMRVERTPEASGSCYLVGGVEPAGWNETRNSNFSCNDEFTGRQGDEGRFKWMNEPRHKGCFNIERCRLVQTFVQSTVRSDNENNQSAHYELTGVRSTIPMFHSLCINLDHTTFLIICKEVHLETSSQYQGSVPYALFLHEMTCYLYANLLMRCEENACMAICDYQLLCAHFENVKIPRPIYEYVAAIGRIRLNADEIIYHNLPKIAIPDDGSEYIAGTFGKVNESTHNVYECYISPYVTKRLIEETIRANESGEFVAWNPLPEDYAPRNAVATENLLGYSVPERISKKALDTLKRVKFCPGVGFVARLCLTKPSLHTFIDTGYKSNSSKIQPNKIAEDAATLGYLHVYESNSCELHSPVHLSQQESAKALLFGMRRKRTSEASGPCYLVDGVEPAGWNETRNDNFSCKGHFNPTGHKVFLASLNDDREIGEDFNRSRIKTFVGQFILPDSNVLSSDDSDYD